jgi:glutamate synthase (NADPH) small chain
MGKLTGFLEVIRSVPPERPAAERVRDWDEFHLPVADDHLAAQGSRCMDCGTPYCHSGTLMAGMASGCPLSNLIPDWNDLVYRGQWMEASIQLHRTNNFPEFTGRVCPAPCEGSCTVGLHGGPVTIKTIECAIADRSFDEGWEHAAPPVIRTGKRVAVVGSGPAGLAAAAQLNLAGHTVTVLERADRVGGLLMYGIPNMKLDKSLVQRRVRFMADAGVRFVTGVDVGRDIPAERLLGDYDAVVLCCGATKARDLDVEGRTLAGVHLAMEYLTASTRRLLGDAEADVGGVTARGRHVIVIGGGDTGTDCVATAIRQGAASVTQLELLPPPPTSRAASNPWPEWPRILRTDYAHDEARAVYGADPRRFATRTMRLAGTEAGHVCRVDTVQVEWQPDSNGRLSPVDVPGTEREIPADLVLLAMGFTGPETGGVAGGLGVQFGDRGTVVTDADTMTTVPGIFAAGDMVRGQSLVVWAIREGRRAARGVDRYLMSGDSTLP